MAFSKIKTKIKMGTVNEVCGLSSPILHFDFESESSELKLNSRHLLSDGGLVGPHPFAILVYPLD